MTEIEQVSAPLSFAFASPPPAPLAALVKVEPGGSVRVQAGGTLLILWGVHVWDACLCLVWSRGTSRGLSRCGGGTGCKEARLRARLFLYTVACVCVRRRGQARSTFFQLTSSILDQLN